MIRFIECLILIVFVCYNLSQMYTNDVKTGKKHLAWYPLHGDIFRVPIGDSLFCIVVGIVFALLAYACIVVGARSEDNRAGGN